MQSCRCHITSTIVTSTIMIALVAVSIATIALFVTRTVFLQMQKEFSGCFHLLEIGMNAVYCNDSQRHPMSNRDHGIGEILL